MAAIDQPHSQVFNNKNPLSDKAVMITGIARNCEKTIVKEINRLQDIFAGAKDIYWLIVESDSDDETCKQMCLLKKEIQNFRYISLGKLRSEMPLRTQRIAHCRNKYLDEINTNSLYNSIDYIVISDLDGMNDKLTKKALYSCWEKDEWDVCTANQDGRYYDIWALRHPTWSPNDCWLQQRFLLDHGLSHEKALFAAVYSKMIYIQAEADWIAVDSAFGGLAIYRKNVLKNVSYIGLNSDGEEICEHVTLHAQLKSRGFKIYINPRLINTGNTHHSCQLGLTKALRRIILRILRSVALCCLSKKMVQRIRSVR